MTIIKVLLCPQCKQPQSNGRTCMRSECVEPRLSEAKARNDAMPSASDQADGRDVESKPMNAADWSLLAELCGAAAEPDEHGAELLLDLVGHRGHQAYRTLAEKCLARFHALKAGRVMP